MLQKGDMLQLNAPYLMVSLGVWGTPIIIDGPPKRPGPPNFKSWKFWSPEHQFCKNGTRLCGQLQVPKSSSIFHFNKILTFVVPQLPILFRTRATFSTEKILKTQCFQVAKTALKIVSFSKLPLILNMSFHTFLALDNWGYPYHNSPSPYHAQSPQC